MRPVNSAVTREDMKLVPLYSVLTGQGIEDFPENLRQLDGLHGRQALEDVIPGVLVLG